MKIVDILLLIVWLWSQTHKHKYSPLYTKCVKMYCVENQSVNLVSVD